MKIYRIKFKGSLQTKTIFDATITSKSYHDAIQTILKTFPDAVDFKRIK